MEDRVQRVIINGQFSEWTQIKAGVPQGSVLGPLLFLVFINDIVDVIHNCNVRLFADDTCLFIEIDSKDISEAKINEDLDSIELWANSWLINFSAQKTKTMTLGTRNDAIPNIIFQNSPIEEVE